jgi:rubrerythrin
MEEQTIAKRLIALAQLDIDAVHAYTQAIEEIDLPKVRDELEGFCADHLRHIDELSALIISMDAEPPQYKKDFKGYLIEGMTALRSATGTAGALKAMRMNEKLTNARYEAALDGELPDDVLTVVRANLEDERRHLRFIEKCIDEGIWELEEEEDEAAARRRQDPGEARRSP